MLAFILSAVVSQNPVWAQNTTDAGLSGSERSCFAGVITAAWPAAVPADITYLHCTRQAGGSVCHYVESASGTAAQYVADEAAGVVVEGVPTWNGTTATYQRVRRATLTTAQAGDLASCIVIVWPSAGTAQTLTIEKVASTYPASLDHHVTGTAAQYLTAKAAGLVVKRIQ